MSQSVVFPVYTASSFTRCFPDGSYESYLERESQFPEVMQEGIERFGQTFKTFRFVVIEEEYFQWLQETGRENEEESRLLYANSVTPEEVERLWQTYRPVRQSTYFMVVMLTGFAPDAEAIPTHSFTLTDSQRKRLKHLFMNERKLSKDDVFVHRDMVTSDTITEEYMLYLLKEAFPQVAIDCPEMLLMHIQQPESNFAIRLLPVTITSQPPCIVKKNEYWLWEHPLEWQLSEKKVLRWAADLNSLPGLHDKDIFAAPYLTNYDLLEDVLEEIKSSLQQAAVEAGIAIRG